MTTQSRTVGPEELRADTEKMDTSDSLNWLLAERNIAHANSVEAMNSGDMVAANRWQERAQRFTDSSKELQEALKKCREMERVLTNRVIVALKEAERPSFSATHKHYKGGVYRVLLEASDANGVELIDGVVYDDPQGRTYFLHKDKFLSVLPSGKPRYEMVLK